MMAAETYTIDYTLFAEFIDETLESLQPLEYELLELEKNSNDTELINKIFRPIHSLKGSSAFFGMIKSQRLIHQMENVLDRLRKDQLQVTSDLINLLLQGLDVLTSIFSKSSPEAEEIIDNIEYFEKLCAQLESVENIERKDDDVLAQIVPMLKELKESIPQSKRGIYNKIMAIAQLKKATEPTPSQSIEPDKQESTAPESENTQKVDKDKTMRISERKLESFFEHVGELVIVSEMFRHISGELNSYEELSNLSKNFKQILSTFDILTSNLQESVMAVKKVPVKNILQKIPRLVKETSKQTGKKIDVLLSGEHNTIDKSYMELLDAPLTHMIRNAVDHGIEDPHSRLTAGKPEVGLIKVSLDLDEENIHLKISDDGRGLDIDRIHSKAISSGIVSNDEPLTQDKILDFLFKPGFSTAEQVTDISGRGVGMDVVKQKINSAGGHIDVVNRPGNGVDFKIILPQVIETQIMTGFLIETRGEIYVFEMDTIRESFCIEKNDITSVNTKDKVISRYDDFISLYDLGAILKSESFAEDLLNRKRISVVTVDIEDKFHAFMVDDIIGVRKVVVKSPPFYVESSSYYAGTAIMGDGSVAMVLNGEGLINSM